MKKIAIFVVILFTGFSLKAVDLSVWSASPASYTSSSDVSDYGTNSSYTATLNANAAIQNLTLQDWSSANTSLTILSGSGSKTLTINNLDLAGDYFELNIGSGVTLVVNGTTTSNGGKITVLNGGSIIFNNTVTLSGDGMTLDINSGGYVDVNSTLTFTGGINILNIAGELDVNTLVASGGSQQLNITGTGVVKVIGNASFTGSAAFSVTNNGALRIGGDLTVDGGASGFVDTNASLLVGGSINLYSGTKINGTGTKTSGIGASTALPVKLIEFSANYIQNYVDIRWSTASEINNDYFVIEYSLDAVDWQILNYVQGNGNTSTISEYQYQHFTKNSYYYRLKQVDNDGNSEIFLPVFVNSPYINEDVDYQVYDIMSRFIMTGKYNEIQNKITKHGEFILKNNIECKKIVK
jgi:hypothetical protein